MNKKEIEQLLHKYFEGETTLNEERNLEAYFQSGEVAEDLKKYITFFSGISELAEFSDDSGIEEDVMDFILEAEHQEKTKYRWLWKTVTGIAASVIIVLGGFLFYQQQKQPFEDTFENPEQAYAYAQQTLQFVSGKYSIGLAEFSNFGKLQKANEPIRKGVDPVNAFFQGIEKMGKAGALPKEEKQQGMTGQKEKETHAIDSV